MIINTPYMSEMLDCYQQSGKFADGSILPKHYRELPENYVRRKKAINSPAIYSYLINSHDCIFSHAPARSDADELFVSHFAYNAGNGLDLNSLLNRALKLSQVMGSCFLVMDAPTDQPDNLESMIDQRAYPYIDIILPNQVTDIQLDRVGNITSFSYSYVMDSITYTRTHRAYSVTDTGLKSKQSQTYTIPVKMPVIPVITSGAPLISGELPPSPTTSLYQNQLSIAITNSLIDEELHTSAFPLLVITGAVDAKNLTLGAQNGLQLPTGSTANYLSPASNTIDSKLKRIESCVSMMIKIHANLITNSDISQSGVAKMMDRTTGAAYLRYIAGVMEKIEYRIYDLWCGFTNQPRNERYTVSYYKNFDMTSIMEYIAGAIEMLGIDFSDESKLEIKRDLLKKYFSGDDEIILPRILQAESMTLPTEPADEITELSNDEII